MASEVASVTPALSVSGDVVIVGANGNNSGQGASYIYERDQGGLGNWGNLTKLVASDGMTGDGFGFSVALGGDDFLVGALSDDIGANITQGSAYIYNFIPLIARDDFVLTPLDTPVTIYPLNNDGDPNGDPMTLDSVGTPLTGIVSINGATLVYTPTLGFLGTDTFTYTISTATESATAAVSVLVAQQVFRVQLPLVRR